METKYSARAGMVIKEAKDLAILHNNPQIEDLHVHLALLQQNHSPLDQVFEYFAIDKASYQKKIQEAVERLSSNPGLSNLYYSRDYQRLLLQAKEVAKELYHTSISTLHLFLALLRLEGSTSYHFLQKNGFDYQATYDYILELSQTHNLNERYPQGLAEVLKQYGSDLTEAARQGQIDPVVGMDDEINRVIQVLSRRIKNNPVIVGEPGVGKTAVVEGLAHRIVNQDVPESLRHRMIFSLRLSDVIAGSKLRGEFEEKLREILDIVANANHQIILFIDELHTVVGTGGGSGGVDTSNILKPLLARGQINVIGATTHAEYARYIQKDGALERRFQKIIVQEPSVSDTISILRGIKSKYEAYHGLRIKDEALVACAKLSDRYITGRRLPDKAIDVMDEACSMVRTEIDAMPVELDDLKRRILQLQVEKVRLKEEDSTNPEVAQLQAEIEKLTDQFEADKAIWQSEKRAMKKLQKIQDQIDQLERQTSQAQQEDDFEEIVNYSHVKIPKLRAQAQELLSQPYRYNLIEEVNRQHICEIISKSSGIPVMDLNQDEVAQLLNLDQRLREKVIGQEAAIHQVAGSILRAKVGLKAVNKPIASFLFLGPTGVGKTYLAKVLASELYQGPEALIRLDMSEYMEKNSVTKLIGAPPGYIGYEEGGQLTERILNQPYSIILFDEIEKAHPQIFNLLLQILDEGQITDNKGRRVDFANTLILLTSNVAGESVGQEDHLEDQLLETFRPEFLNRLTGIILFRRLTKSAIRQIIDLHLEETVQLLADRQLSIELSPASVEAIMAGSDYLAYGSREVVRLIHNEIETLLAVAILQGQVKDRAQILVDYNDQQQFYIAAID